MRWLKYFSRTSSLLQNVRKNVREGFRRDVRKDFRKGVRRHKTHRPCRQAEIPLTAQDLLERGLPAKHPTRCVRLTKASASRGSLAPTEERGAGDALAEIFLANKFAPTECSQGFSQGCSQECLQAQNTSPLQASRDTAHCAGPVGARLAREAPNAVCQVDQGVGFAGKPRSNRGTGRWRCVG
jgi:hypothetical protein